MAQSGVQAKKDTVDPQYLWILPEHLKPTMDISMFGGPRGHVLHDDGSRFAYLLTTLSVTSTERLLWLDTMPLDITALEVERYRFCADNDYPASKLGWRRYGFWNGALKTFRQLGLDVHGGLRRLLELRDRVILTSTSYSASPLLIGDAESLRQYMDIGVHLYTDVPEYPKNLDEAASAYVKLSSLITETITLEEVEKKIQESTDNNETWELKRVKFRPETKEKYRKILLEVSQEEFLDQQLQDLRNRKRTRVNE
ncbi:hypothetical protein P154DRAFT_531725 [Amniculicola lignicola CBS 123094]|uniref:Uncharacterized protein n=1 Tax=Amniculicola lignicola CBS 123094 TaxID=1392246 RepID=A0A6A5WSU2_9PLEO|nr:hypothetical protein P154DRAFT_531725 [Amniculicola lignicola CBS 123094]